MASPFPDDSAFEEEVELRTEVRTAIDLAIDDVLGDRANREITEVEEQKLTHFAIRDFDLPLTYSWYLAGGHLAAPSEPETQSPFQYGPAFGDIKSQRHEYKERVEELRSYFRSEEFFPGYNLNKVWFTDKFEFLRDYYRELAPEKYRDLYIHSLEIREELWYLSDAIERQSENSALADFDIGEPNTLLDQSIEESLRHLVSDYHMDLAEIDELSGTKRHVSSGTDVIELILSKLTHSENAGVEQKIFMQEDIHDFFYYYVWKYPALAISVDTVEGPNAEALQRKRLLEFNGFEDVLAAETESFTNQARGVGLLPGVHEGIAKDTEKSKYLHSVIKETVDIDE